jgi:hypothetical protein
VAPRASTTITPEAPTAWAEVPSTTRPGVLVHAEAVLDRGDTAQHRVARSLRRPCVGCHLELRARRLFHQEADALGRIDVLLIVDHDLDQTSAEMDVLPYRFAYLIPCVCKSVLRFGQIRFVGRKMKLAAERGGDPPRVQHGGPHDETPLDRLPKAATRLSCPLIYRTPRMPVKSVC